MIVDIYTLTGISSKFSVVLGNFLSFCACVCWGRGGEEFRGVWLVGRLSFELEVPRSRAVCLSFSIKVESLINVEI